MFWNSCTEKVLKEFIKVHIMKKKIMGFTILCIKNLYLIHLKDKADRHTDLPHASSFYKCSTARTCPSPGERTQSQSLKTNHLPLHSKRKLESGAAPALQARHSTRGLRHRVECPHNAPFNPIFLWFMYIIPEQHPTLTYPSSLGFYSQIYFYSYLCMMKGIKRRAQKWHS